MDPVRCLDDILDALGGSGDGDVLELLDVLRDWIARGGATDALAERAGEYLDALRSVGWLAERAVEYLGRWQTYLDALRSEEEQP